MRETFAHDAILTMRPDGDIRAPGAAVTAALCGTWHHEPPCPLAPHHCQADRVGGQVRVRVLFAAEPDLQNMVRDRIVLRITEVDLNASSLRSTDGTAALSDCGQCR